MLRTFQMLLFCLLAIHALAGDIICVEAESAKAVTAPMLVVSATNRPAGPAGIPAKSASGGQYLEIPQGKGNPPKVKTGSARLAFTITERDQYYMWCRAWWVDECGNSFTMQIDDERPFTFGQDGTYKCWHWIKAPPRLKQLKLSKGTHTLTVMNREDGVKLDQVLLTSDRRYVPVGIEDVTTK